MAYLFVLHGPNLNLLGTREQSVYGKATLAEINNSLIKQATLLGHELLIKQSNAEHELIQWVQDAKQDGIVFLLLNPGGYTHTSVALRDAVLAVELPFIEIHLSNPHAREPFRRQSYFSDIAKGVICGFGADSYRYALQAAHEFLHQT